MHGCSLAFIIALALATHVIAIKIPVDNLSPQIVFSPLPCYVNSVQGCSTEWRLCDMGNAFNGSVTRTTGQDPSQNLDVLPRASLVFQGTDIVFMPGMQSTAQASVVVDDRASVLLNTSQAAFAGTGLDPTQNHTITVTFLPSANMTTLDVDYFLITQPDGTDTSTPSSSSSFFTTALPTTLPTSTATQVPLRALSQPSIPVGTIAAVSLSGALVLIIGFFAIFFAVRRRRRRDALRRERAILYDLHLPSERRRKGKEVPWAAERGRRDLEPTHTREKEKGKARERDPQPYRPSEPELEWRIATPRASLLVGHAPSSEHSVWP